jgi:two-component system response regulator PilR (NtrC family)
MNQYRLPLLDYKMPGMDGLELCRRLRGHQPGIVVALVTAFASAATTEAAGEAGVRRIIPKPVDFPVLIRLVEDVVGGAGRG